MQNKVCEFQGECEIFCTNEEDSCFVKKIIKERNLAEDKYNKLINDISLLDTIINDMSDISISDVANWLDEIER